MENNNDGAPSAERRERIITLLEQYPRLGSDELAELLRWFRKEASALDVGLIASDHRVAAQYEGLKQDHLDRTTGGDVLWMTAFAATGFAALALLVWSVL